MKRLRSTIALYFSIWHGLLALAGVILIYLTGVHISEALNTASLFTFFNTEHAFLTWEPSRGQVDHYLLEITDTQLIGGGSNSERNRLTATRYETSLVPRYSLQCFHNHSYQVRIKAISAEGVSSDYSEPSILFICDREPPKLSLAALPSPLHKVRSQNIIMTGRFDEPHVETLFINDTAAVIDYQRHTFSAALTLAPGENTIEVYARDLAGNTSTDRSVIAYAPITILSMPPNARLYWNGNFAYPGSYGGTTPRAYNYAGEPTQTLRVSLPGFQDFFGIIDFSDLSRDSYIISLNPHVPSCFSQLGRIVIEAEGPLPVSFLHPFVVDFNLDGQKDLLVGEADGTVRLLLNRGSAAVPLFPDQRVIAAEDGTIDVGTNAAPFMLDYDNNGSVDLLVGNGDGHLYYYANRGNNTVPSFSAPDMITGFDGIPLNVESDCTPWVIDWNGDHRKDLLMGSANGTLTLSINVGSDSAPLFASPQPLKAGGSLIAADGPTAPCVIDWNADGQPDVLMGAGDGSIHVYYATAGRKEPEISQGAAIQINGQPLVLEGSLSPFPVDWNGDGKNELLIGNGDGGMHLLE